jgi:hypothetical protein
VAVAAAVAVFSWFEGRKMIVLVQSIAFLR